MGPPPGPMGSGLPPEMLAQLKRGFAGAQLGAPEGAEPPNYRPAESPGQACMTCVEFRPSGETGQGACSRFAGYPVEAEGVCDVFIPQEPGAPLIMPLGREGAPMMPMGPMG